MFLRGNRKGLFMANKMSQKDMILKYINDFGSISSWQAYSDLGITQLGARIWELSNKKGYKFKKERIYTENRYGKRCHYDKYMLVED